MILGIIIFQLREITAWAKVVPSESRPRTAREKRCSQEPVRQHPSGTDGGSQGETGAGGPPARAQRRACVWGSPPPSVEWAPCVLMRVGDVHFRPSLSTPRSLTLLLVVRASPPSRRVHTLQRAKLGRSSPPARGQAAGAEPSPGPSDPRGGRAACPLRCSFDGLRALPLTGLELLEGWNRVSCPLGLVTGLHTWSTVGTQ